MIASALLGLLGRFFVLFGYIGSDHAFPLPLEPDEEKALLERTIKGDIEARNKLIEHNLRLVAHISKKFSANSMDMEDLISIGTLGLIKAVSTYDHSKGAQLATYAARCIENEILMALRAGKKKKNEVSLQESMGMDRDGNVIRLGETLGYTPQDITECVQHRDELIQMHALIHQVLTARERMIIELRYGLNETDPKTQKEIGKILGISRSYVSRIEKKALRKLEANLLNLQK